MTFQIEESELVAEPLPKADERRALMFYEAAEGGAGVLTRIASDPASLAQVASNALKLLHYNAPQGPWKLEDLPALEQTNALGNRICEAAAINACCPTLTNLTTKILIVATPMRSRS
jgi:hypothetical protein